LFTAIKNQACFEVTQIGGRPICGNDNIDLAGMPKGSPTLQQGGYLRQGGAEAVADIKTSGTAQIKPRQAQYGQRAETINDNFNKTPNSSSTPPGGYIVRTLDEEPVSAAPNRKRAAIQPELYPQILYQEQLKHKLPSQEEQYAESLGYSAVATESTSMATAVPVASGGLLFGAISGNLTEAVALKVGASKETAYESGLVGAMASGAAMGALIGAPTGIGAPVGAVVGAVFGLACYLFTSDDEVFLAEIKGIILCYINFNVIVEFMSRFIERSQVPHM
jgi:hypothetical protein